MFLMKTPVAIQLRTTYFLFQPLIYRAGRHNVNILHLSLTYDRFEDRPGTKHMLPEFSSEFTQHLQVNYKAASFKILSNSFYR
jgi:hypothetical protein